MSNHVCPKILDSSFVSKLATWRFSPDVASAHDAWVATLEILKEKEIPAVDETQIIVDELAANAIIHAHTEFELSIELWSDCLRIIVRDKSKLKPAIKYPDPLEESGRGLFLLDNVADDWGYHPTESGKCIWASIRLSA